MARRSLWGCQLWLITFIFETFLVFAESNFRKIVRNSVSHCDLFEQVFKIQFFSCNCSYQWDDVFCLFYKDILGFVFVSLGSATEERNEETEQFQ